MALALLALCTLAACEGQTYEQTSGQCCYDQPGYIEMQDYTPVPTPLTGDLSLPQDAIDDVVVGTVNPTFQQLADGVAFNTLARVARYSFDAGVVANGAIMPIHLEWEYPNGWGVTANEVTFPYTGAYSLSAQAFTLVGSATDGVRGVANIEILGVQIGEVDGIRWGTDTAKSTVITGITSFIITDVSTQKLSFTNQSSVNLTLGGSEPLRNPIVVTYLGKY